MTASKGTLQNMEIFWRNSLSSGRSQRQTRTWGSDADFPQFGDRLLRGLGLQLAGGGDERHVGDVHENGVVVAHLQRELADGLQERQPLDVAGRAADFGDDHVRLGLFGQRVDAVLDLVGDVRDHLDGFAQVFALAFIVSTV